MIEKTYNVGIYCRLSNDDERDGESVSIENQKLLLQSYVRQRGWNEIAVYCDDGYSGTNFNRPGVKRLIEDAKAKKINLILVKDLSRFGRNYIEFGQYTDYLFPSLGCRFIALNNGIDTMSDNGSTDVMCFLNLFNEFYSRDTSKKVKAVKRACAESGKFMGTYPAYGYKRDPEDKHHLVIDEETAPTVRRIFSMRASGMGFRAIAVTLNEEGVLPPGALYYQRKGRSDPRNVNHKWAETTVKALIRSEVYIGNMVQGKTGTLSYKSRKLVGKPEEEWIRVEGTHEPIISREVWDTVVSIDKKKVRKTPPTDGIRSIFTGLVYCADCGFKMRNHIERFTYKDGTPGRYSSFICGNYARSGKSACTIHSIYENVLEELVLTDIREKARFVECDGERLAEQISRMKEKESRSRVISYEQELKAAAARMTELERLMQNLYEDKCTGTIPQTVFQTLMRKYETERAEKAAAIPELEQKVRAQLENRQDANRWMEVIRRYTEITALDENILFELVDRIEVGEARKVNGQRICDVKVVYRYVGSVDDALAQERQEAYEKLYKVGIYCRLSVDDASNSAKVKNYIPADESVSIENQYELLSKFVMLNGWTEVKSYRDDGYSGGNFQRPGFLEMLEDARHGLINLILVKDLSRLGRDFVEVGRYTDVVFPSLGCRFVSVLDCLDTEGDNTDMLHFRSLMNDYHLKDLSNKVKSVLHAKMRSGQYIAAYAPYGYRKSEEDRHRLVIDEEAAAVVRRMFELRRAGMAYGKIAAVLNSEGILSPRWYWAKLYGNGSCKYANLWMYATVKNILTNEVYTGNLIQNQTGSRSYKDDTMIYKPESEWIRHEALHEAIISPEVWNEVQAINRERTLLSADNAPPKPFLFTGKLICADCKAPLQGNRETQRRKNGTSKKYVSYFCSRYTASGYGACSRHTIYEMTLTELVLSEIRAHAEALELDEAAMLDRLQAQRIAADAERLESVRQEIGKLRRRVYELEQMTAKLYEDKVCGSISAASFAVLLEKTEQERRQRTDRLDTLLAEVREYEQSAADIQSWAAVVRKHLHIRELDRETVDELIDRIEVGEKTVVDGKNVRDIKIYYRFVGNI